MKAPTTTAKRKKPNPGSKPYVPPKDLSPFGAREWPLHRPGSVAVCLPFPPSVNLMYRSAGNKSVLSVLGRTYKDLCASLLMNARRLDPPRAPIYASVLFAVPDLQRRDFDNLFKATLDVIAKALGFDDSEIWEGGFRKQLDRRSPRVSVVLSPGRPELMGEGNA